MAASAAPQTSQDALDLVTLKAKAYDCLVQIEHWQRELQKVNQEIAALVRPTP